MKRIEFNIIVDDDEAEGIANLLCKAIRTRNFHDVRLAMRDKVYEHGTKIHDHPDRRGFCIKPER